MKFGYILLILIVFAWPLNYLYQRQLGAISFLLLAIFFLVISIKEMKKHKQAKENDSKKARPEKFK
jgi:Ca2+/Na+ antiporter